jgi:hypothetical protein
MIKFDTFEELQGAYPIDGEANVYHEVILMRTYVLTEQDKVIVTERNPYGWLDGQKYFYYSLNSYTWYDSYVYNSGDWYLGSDSWDGVIPADLPPYGVQTRPGGIKVAIFKTKKEAEEYMQKVWDARLAF